MNFTNCHYEGEIDNLDAPAGGLFAVAPSAGGPNSYFERCSVTGKIFGGNYTGGFCGQPGGTDRVKNCYVKADITGEMYVGGLMGFPASPPHKESTTIENCYLAITLSADDYFDIWHGATWEDGLFEFVNSYWDKDLLEEFEEDEMARTTEEMTEPHADNTYQGWAFDEVWYIFSHANDGYPVLEYHEDPFLVRFTRTPQVQRKQPTANRVLVVSSEGGQGEAELPGISEDEIIERKVEIEEGGDGVCRKVAEKLLERWSREQVSILGEIDLNMALDFKEEIFIQIDEAKIEDYYPIQSLEHDITDYTTTVTAGDIILDDNELLARILDEIS